MASAFFVFTANAWINQPTGFDQEGGRLVAVDPWAAMFNPATPPQTAHMILAAFMVAGFGMASVYAVAMLHGRRDRYHRLGFLIPFTVAAVPHAVQQHQRGPVSAAVVGQLHSVDRRARSG